MEKQPADRNQGDEETGQEAGAAWATVVVVRVVKMVVLGIYLEMG